jgi:quinol monooxygenase YgiN
LEWYAFQISETEYGIFDTFASEDAREAHHAGELAQAIGQVAPDLLSEPPQVQPTRIVATKHEGSGGSA